MQNAHLRLGQLDYARSSTSIKTNIRLHVDHYMGEAGQGHLLSLFGGDAEVGAIAAAIQEKHPFTLTFPDGKSVSFNMGPDASCYKGSLIVPGRKQPLRHLLAVSQPLHANGTAGRTFLLNYERTLAWSTLVSFLGLPAEHQRRDALLNRMRFAGGAAQLPGEERSDSLARVPDTRCATWSGCPGPVPIKKRRRVVNDRPLSPYRYRSCFSKAQRRRR